mmetsp:Transcript_80305/g.236221  ORF Transcript_80305/g.236221 Transcript_80305/m.236221 type:complete len:632 (+) Transcript_80305:75-1970(+)
MIHFDREVWTTVFYWEGGIIREIFKPALKYLVYLLTVFGLQKAFGNLEFGTDRHSLMMITSFLVFLLVFRVNSTHANHRHVALEVNHVFSIMESLIDFCCSSLAGAKPEEDPHLQRQHAEHAIVAKLNAIRLSLAYAISFVFHSCIITAVTEMQGEIDEASLKDLVFLRHRLQGLLYSKEMRLVDQAISIVQEQVLSMESSDARSWCPPSFMNQQREDDQPVYRGEACRHRPGGEQCGKVVLGKEVALDGPDEEDAQDSSVLPLPKVIMPMLLMSLKRGIGQPWGYPERLWSIFSNHLVHMKTSLAVIDSMCATPTPLPYVQLCHLLVLIFGIFYPLTIPITDGAIDTLVMPFLIFCTIEGFQSLGKMLETPTGHDVTDLNFFELLHNLEIQAKAAFDSTEKYAHLITDSLDLPMKSFNFTLGKEPRKRCVELEGLPRHFSAYFHWLPMPVTILETLLRAHGHADALRQAESCKGKAQLSQLLRLTVNKMEGRNTYTSLMGGPEESQEVLDALEAIRQDPNIFSHYLVFAGVHDPERSRSSVAASTGCSSPTSQSQSATDSHAAWKRRVGTVLHDHAAAKLFGVNVSDSERSSLGTFRDVDPDLETPLYPDLEERRTPSYTSFSAGPFEAL